MKTKRDSIIDEIYDYIMKNGAMSSKPDILDNHSRVYTKKILVNIKHNDTTIKVVSVTGYEPDLKDTSDSDIRICFNNYDGKYLNLFARLVKDDTLDKILKYLKSHD